MAKQAEFIKEVVVKTFMRSKKIRSKDQAVTELARRFSEVMGRVIVESGNIAKKNKKKTVTEKHITEAFEKHVGKTDLDWEEILTQVLQETPADIGKVSKGIRKYIEQNKK